MAIAVIPKLTPDTFDIRPMFRFYHVTENLYIFAFVAHLFLLALFIGHGVMPMALYNIFSLAVFLVCLTLNRRRRHYYAFLFGSLEVVLHAVLAARLVGVAAGFHLTVLTLGPCMFLLPFRKQFVKWVLMILSVVIFLSIHYYLLPHLAPYRMRGEVADVFFIANVLIITISISLLTYYLSRASWAAETYISYLTQIDPLTGILNRRGIEEALKLARSSTSTTGERLALLIGDIDDFKHLNDNFGHNFGDFVLTETVRRMQSSLRASDFIGRWGGEEFLVILPSTGIEGAEIVGKKILATVSSTVMRQEQNEASVTLTIGATVINPDEALAESLKRADTALYRGKQLGKNRIVVR